MKKRKSKNETVAKASPDFRQEQIVRLKEVFPECVAEGKVDFDKLRATLGGEIDSRPERYSFSWAGKRDCIRLLQTPSRATLVPCPEESVNFEETGNLFIEGDNLEVLKLLYRSYFGRVKMIYIDPPYNTGNDFIYPDNFTDPLDTYLKITGQKDSQGNLLTTNPETSGRYHSAWLSMMYPRLFLARQLLREDGGIFISIDDKEVNSLRFIMNEIFGEENFIASFVWQKKYSRDNRPVIGTVHEHILLFAKDACKFAEVRNLLLPDEKSKAVYRNPNNDPRGRWRPVPMTAQAGHATQEQFYEIRTPSGVAHLPPTGRCWSLSEQTFKKLLSQGRIWFGKDGSSQPNVIRYLTEIEGFVPWTWLPSNEVGHTDEAKKEIYDLLGRNELFETPKPSRLIKRILQIGTSSNEKELVFDFFSGSCTTAQATLELNREDSGNRRFIMVQLPEPTGNESFPSIADIGKERIRQVIEKMHKDQEGELDLKIPEEPEDLGFRVFKLSESNYRPWAGVEEKKPDAYAETMDLFTDPLNDGWKPKNVIWEVALKEGYGLNSRIEKLSAIKGNTVYRMTDKEKEQSFRICLDDKLRPASLKALKLGKDDVFFCRDSALDDEKVANLALQCRLKTI